ncbi:MAG: hypothetical protein GY749_06315 [Desulfobacteraceae bacterium]|nr:hypothetical protein [Desulfobacteraceae bacterium]
MKFQKNIIRFVMSVCMMFFASLPALSQETYKFERMWPVLTQPWYFVYPSGVAVDGEGYVYIADMYGYNIQKFTSDGRLVTKWGTYGSSDGQFKFPRKIAIDNENRVLYVTDSLNHRVQKFTLEGQFTDQWKTSSEINLSLRPTGIALNRTGEFVYVTDTHRHYIQKFSPDGVLICKWGKQDETAGSDNGEFNEPSDVATDSKGFVYVADSKNCRIQKFTQDGQFELKWGTYGNDDGQFVNPRGIATDNNDFIYVTDTGDQSVQKFADDGTFKAKWKISEKTGFNIPAEFYSGIAATTDINGSVIVYLADSFNHSVQKYRITEEEQIDFISKWTATGEEDGKFDKPAGIAIDEEDFVYVSDSYCHRIQKFSPTGEFVLKWGKYGTGDEELNTPGGIAVDKKRGYVYVVDSGNSCIKKFDLNGNFLFKWSGDFRLLRIDGGEYFELPYLPSGIAVDEDGFVYVSDPLNFMIKKFTPHGELVTSWEIISSQFPLVSVPVGVAVDSNNAIYVTSFAADLYNLDKLLDSKSNIQKFNSDGSNGKIFCQYDIESILLDIWTDDTNNIYVTDVTNSRIDKFSHESANLLARIENSGYLPGQIKFPIGLCTNKDGKLYVSDTGNHRIQVFRQGLPTDKKQKAVIVAGAGEKDNLWNDIQANANFAYLALLYQGFEKEDILYLNPNENNDLDSNGILDDVDGDATVENLEQAITVWAETGADDLILYLIDHGGDGNFLMNSKEKLSACELSSYLNILQNTVPVRVIVIYDACRSGSFLPIIADKEMLSCGHEYEKQTTGRERIFISSASDESAHFLNQGLVSFSNFFWTSVFYGDTLRDAFEYAKDNIINYQNPMLDGDDDGTGNEMPDDYDSVKDFYIGVNNADFSPEGPVITDVPDNINLEPGTAYDIGIDVADKDGVIDVRAIIKRPDYTPAPDIPELKLPEIEFDRVGTNSYRGIYDKFDKPGIYKVIIHAEDSKHNLSSKSTEVTVGTLTNHKAVLAAGYFSDELWPELENNIRVAYNVLYMRGYSKDNIYLISPKAVQDIPLTIITPTPGNLKFAIEDWAAQDTGDVVLYLAGNSRDEEFQINETEWVKNIDLDSWLDNLQAKIPGLATVILDTHYSGYFIQSLVPEPDKNRIVISGISDNQKKYVSFSYFFWKEILKGETILAALSNVSGQYSFDMELDDNGNGIPNEDTEGQLAETYIIGSVTQDIYEEDDDYINAGSIDINENDDGIPQVHNFHDAGDEDWIKFYGLSDTNYRIVASNLGPHCDVVIELYDTDGSTLLSEKDTMFNERAVEVLEYSFDREDIYYVKIRHKDPIQYGEGTEYDLKVYFPIGDFPGEIRGIITDLHKNPVENAVIRIYGCYAGQPDKECNGAVSRSNGKYKIICEAYKTYSMTVEKDCYESFMKENIVVNELEETVIDITLSGCIGLMDSAINLLLKMLSESLP